MKVHAYEQHIINSDLIPVKSNTKYLVTSTISSKSGMSFSIFFGVFILNSQNKEILRRYRWVNDFKGNKREYTIIFQTPQDAKYILTGYRINVETPRTGDAELDLQDVRTIKVQEVEKNMTESFDDPNYILDKLPSLNIEEELVLEKKMIWILGSPRSGSTWLGKDLLCHESNVYWHEPYIGWHLGLIPQWLWGESSYFFSLHHKNNWLPYMKKVILQRTFSQVQTLSKNVIIKEPNGSIGVEILMDCFPKSKLIFLLRDGRDVIDSLLDAERPGSWNFGNPLYKYEPLGVENTQHDPITVYAYQWKNMTENVWSAYQKHDPKLRLLVRYEDLRHQTLLELKKIYQFLNVGISDTELNDLVEKNNFEKIPSSERGMGKFNRIAKPGAWKDNLTKEDQDLINSIISKTLIKVGYDVNN